MARLKRLSDLEIDPVTGVDATGVLKVNATGTTVSENIAQWGGTNTSLGQKAMAASVPVTLASDQGALATTGTHPATGTQANVVSSAASVLLLAANAARLGATIYNDSTAILYLLLSGTGSPGGASATVYTAQIPSQGYYEVPFNYAGIIQGIWAAANGNARITELTA